MHIKEQTLDDLLHSVFGELLKNPRDVSGSRGRICGELTGVLLEVTNPRARMSRAENKTHVFSSLGELLWYLAGSNELDFIKYYVSKYVDESEDGKTVYGAYGPRMLKMDGKHDQIRNVISLLKLNRASKRAVIQLFDAADIASRHREVPCTCALQFMVRENKLDAFTSMRSNDAFLGLPHDVFTFTMLQELIARSLGVEVGGYKHAVGSLHLYEDHKKAAQQYMDEGIQARVGVAMPPMPSADPWSSIATILDVEPRIRAGITIDEAELDLDSYWRDLVLLLQAFRHYKDEDQGKISAIMGRLTAPVFRTYLEQKRKSTAKREKQK